MPPLDKGAEAVMVKAGCIVDGVCGLAEPIWALFAENEELPREAYLEVDAAQKPPVVIFMVVALPKRLCAGVNYGPILGPLVIMTGPTLA